MRLFWLGLTVPVVELFTLPDAAVIVALPVVTAVASPPSAMVSTLESEEVHVAELV